MLAGERCMNWSFQQIGGVVLTSLAVLAIAAGVVLWFLRVREKKALLLRIGISVPLSAGTYAFAEPNFAKGGGPAVAALFIMVAYGWVMAIIWVPSVTGFIGGLFG